jgi:hypothetical protein
MNQSNRALTLASALTVLADSSQEWASGDGPTVAANVARIIKLAASMDE